jgi:hypothetical protein
MDIRHRAKTGAAIAVLAALSLGAGCHDSDVAVTTYHYDNLRTGWNQNEKTLTYAKVGSPEFALLHSVFLDDQVDTQPLVVPDEKITKGWAEGKHDVVYVATEGNTVYAIDARSGAVLLHHYFGPPVPMPLGCGNNGPDVGINGTPVIDLSDNVMYAVMYTVENNNPTYRIHEIDLSNLEDKIPSVIVGATHTANGHTFTFQASYQRQRPALLLANGNVYAGFGSFCDFHGDKSRGWVLGWQKGTLSPLPANQLNDTQVSPPAPNFFLSSVWMSGYGLSADAAGSIYFVTGNSAAGTYDGATNIQESVVKLSPGLTHFDLFTPSDQVFLDAVDGDYGSGGALLLPDQSGPMPHIALAAGKDGRLFILDRDLPNMGAYPGGPAFVNIGACWCGQSYFDGRIASSGGANVNVFKIQETPSVALVSQSSSPHIGGSQDGGFFTSVSSAGTSEEIIWAISRPDNQTPADISLYAFAAQGGGSTMTQLFQGTAGTWPYTGGNANVVPVVANGKVYVASYKQLAIFGLK